MLFVLIGIAWIAVVTLLVVLCVMAARSDATPAPAVKVHPRAIDGGLVLWETPPTSTLASDWTLHDITRGRRVGAPPTRGRRSPRKRRIAAPGIR
jgi:hypothetical protein